MFYLINVMFLFAGHSGLLAATEAASWGAARPGAALDSHTADGRRGLEGGSSGAGHVRGAGWAVVRG
jgi:hypothetical protein